MIDRRSPDYDPDQHYPSDDELADAVTVPNTTGESEEYVENNDTDENAAVAEDATAVEEPEEPVENVSQPIVVVKRNQ